MYGTFTPKYKGTVKKCNPKTDQIKTLHQKYGVFFQSRKIA